MEIGPLTVETHPTPADVQFLEDRLHEGTGSVCCRSTRDLHLSSFLYQEYLLEGEALFQHS
jgi:hypothetical protein